MLNIAVLISGGGSNLQSIIDNIENGNITGGKIELVISDRPDCFGIERAKKHNIKNIMISKKCYENSNKFNRAIENQLDIAKIDLVVLAGFLSILDSELINKYRNRIINVHPSLIPSFCGAGYYGSRVHQAAIDYGVKVSGATVHYVDEGTDTGKIILQEAVPVYEDDTAEALAARVLVIEHKLLPEAVKLICSKS